MRHETYDHAYPHCWRTDTPLVYRAVSSWFVQVTAIKDRMLELNQQINWVPEHVRDGSFGKWLEGARDWSISRNRFWGSPIPVWKSDDPTYPRLDVYGSLDELEADFGVRPDDLHRPTIDELTRPNPDDPTGRSTMRRIPDVLDCWFESGSMPFAQVHYPFENTDWFESHFPGDFIVEYIGQTRGWFYTLHVLSTALFDRPAFQNCVVHGVLLGDDGQKLSKRLRNYPDPVDVFETLGADAMRWSMLSSSAVRGGDMVADRRSIEEAVRQALLPIWNSWYFLTLYANAAAADAPDGGETVLDRYALAKARELVDHRHRPHGCLRPLGRVRDRARLPRLAQQLVHPPLARPVLGRRCHRHRRRCTPCSRCCAASRPRCCRCSPTRSGRPSPVRPRCTSPTGRPATSCPTTPTLVAAMDSVREVCSAASSVRKAEGLRVRLPLASLTVAAPDADALGPFVDLIADEVNVKAVAPHQRRGHGGRAGCVARTRASSAPAWAPTCRSCSARSVTATGRAPPTAAVEVLGRALADDEYELAPRAAVRAPPRPRCRRTGGVVTLDTALTPALEAEGLARDLVRAVNEARRTEGLHVSDRIRVVIDVDHHADVRAATEAHRRVRDGRGARRRSCWWSVPTGTTTTRSRATASNSATAARCTWPSLV